MNKRIFSLYRLEYDVGNESARDTNEINRSNEQNGMKFNHRNPLKSKCTKDVDADADPEKHYEEEGDEENDESDNDRKNKRCWIE
ncbi:fam-c protein [Plasmodium vinckei lentum]|uniref:Fam-c protein n=1 Tax=Plasmodium vinckei lentum TaxID=138297 RepID=A0A6V7SKD1_PLAVN|nr:fam-c protein [Plasmodium vinckei lentum]